MEEISHHHMIVQPELPSVPSSPQHPILHAPPPVTDVIAFNSNTLFTKRGMSSVVYAFPLLFPYGVGGFDTKREVKMSETQWVQRLLLLHGPKDGRFSQHYGFLPTVFDILSTVRAFRAQRTTIRVKAAAITKFGLWRKEDVLECIEYSNQCDQRKRRGQAPFPVPDKVQELMSMISVIRPGMAAAWGSDASRGSAQHVGLSYQIRIGIGNIFVTHSPDPFSNFILSINTSNMEDPFHVDFQLDLHELADRAQRKKHACSDPVQCAIYAKHVHEVFIEDFLGWDLKHKGPKAHGGVFGFIDWFQSAAETQICSNLHFHTIARIVGLPRTSSEFKAMLTDNREFVNKFVDYIDAITPPVPFLADSGRSLTACPIENCNGDLEAVIFPGEAYCKPILNHTPATTSVCRTCNTEFRHKDVLLKRVEVFAKQRNIDITNTVKQEIFRCQPPSTEEGELTDEELVYLALALLDYQFHHETHSSSCFKITSRTPLGHICRYLFPKLARLLSSIIDIVDGKLISQRPIGCEYYTLCSLLWTRLSKNNMDLQFLVTVGNRSVHIYTTKYTFKSQNPKSSLTMKVGLLTKAAARTLTATDNDTLSAITRGSRFMNKALYQLTAPLEMHTSMAAYIILNDGPFTRSHDVVYLNLKKMCACHHDSEHPLTRGTENTIRQATSSPTCSREDSIMQDISPDSSPDNDSDDTFTELVDIHVSVPALQLAVNGLPHQSISTTEGDNGSDNDGDATQQDTAQNEVDQYLHDVNIMTDYCGSREGPILLLSQRVYKRALLYPRYI
jgi:hypothetical protein